MHNAYVISMYLYFQLLNVESVNSVLPLTTIPTVTKHMNRICSYLYY